MSRTSDQGKVLSPAKHELGALTGVRFLAAIYVVFHHFVSPNLHSGIPTLQSFLSVGYTAVGFFFLLSGFVLTYSYVNSERTIDRPRFWRARFSRIYPAYVFAFLLAAPFQILGSIHTNGLKVAAEKLTLGAFLVLALLQSWTPWTTWYWNIPAWSLSVEVFFYFCFPFLAILVARLRPRACLPWAAVAWLAGMLIPAIYCASHVVEAQPPFPIQQLAIETNPILRLPDFFIGMLLGRIFTGGFRFSPQWASALAVIALTGMISLLSFSDGIPRLLLSNGFLTPLCALLILALAHQQGWLARLFSYRPLRILGEASYAMYILQFPVSYLLNLNNETFSGFRFLCYLSVLIALSVAVFFFIEQPLRRRLSSPRAEIVAAPAHHSELNSPLAAKAWQL